MTPDNRHLARIIVGLTRSGYAEDQINAVEELLNKYFPKVEDKKAPVLAEQILKKHIIYHLHGDFPDFQEKWILEAMQEYASQERNRAIQECQKLVKDHLGSENFTAGIIVSQIEKLKKS